MTNQANIVRFLVIYGICLPLAIFLGYLLSNPLDLTTFGSVGFVLVVLIAPILLRFHHVLLIVAWNTSAVVFFLPGRPSLWLAMAAISFMICIVNRTMDKNFRFISVPLVTRPLIVLTIVIVGTALATGGVGLRLFGGGMYGGKRYFVVLGIIMGYFAMTSQKIPANRAVLFAMLFFLGGVTNVIGDLAISGSELFLPLAYIFPPNGLTSESPDLGTTRYVGLSSFSSAFFAFMMAKYGVQGIFSGQKPWRIVIFLLGSGAGLYGGYRSFLISVVLIFAIQFVLEGMHRTKLMPLMFMVLVMCGALAVPMFSQMPSAIQRTFAFLPLPINPDVELDAQASSDWRLRMWKGVLPQVPQYLLLGKGFGMASQDFTFATQFRAAMAGEDWLGSASAGDYHNGPLSVILTFGIWGFVAFFWFMAAGWRFLYNNYRYGDPNLRVINAFLLAAFAARIITFTFVVGGLQADLQGFAGWLGLSVALNGGMARPAPETVPAPVKPSNFANVLPRPRSVFSR